MGGRSRLSEGRSPVGERLLDRGPCCQAIALSSVSFASAARIATSASSVALSHDIAFRADLCKAPNPLD